MSLYFFRISSGRYSGASEQPYEFADPALAWTELTGICAGLLGGIARTLKPDAEWRMELLDENRTTIFRISLVSEAVG